MSASPVPPLRTGVKIVDQNGGPTPAFIRWFNDTISSLVATIGGTLAAQSSAEAAQATADGAQPADPDLSAIAALAGTGFAVRTASDTWDTRSLVAGSGIDITNPDGVSGDPDISVVPASAQADSTATDVAGIVADFNSLLGKLRTAGFLTP
jgi:hypothetical protein